MKDYDYSPDKWLIVEFKVPDRKEDFRIFGTWAGGYLSGDAWKLNSGINTVEQDDEYYYFAGDSGSVYRCYKGAYGIIGASNYGMLDIFEKQVKEHNGTMEVFENADTLIKEKWL